MGAIGSPKALKEKISDPFWKLQINRVPRRPACSPPTTLTELSWIVILHGSEFYVFHPEVLVKQYRD